MNKSEKLSFGIITLEFLLICACGHFAEKRKREYLQKHFGVKTIDELVEKSKKGHLDEWF